MWDHWMPRDRRVERTPRQSSQDGQRVSDDDELSEAASRGHTPPRYGPQDPRPRLPGFTTPIQQRDYSYVGMPTASPPMERREGQPTVSEQQVLNVLLSQHLTSRGRPAAPAFRPHLVRHGLPLSSAAAPSALPTAQMTLTGPTVCPSTLDRVTPPLCGRQGEMSCWDSLCVKHKCQRFQEHQWGHTVLHTVRNRYHLQYVRAHLTRTHLTRYRGLNRRCRRWSCQR